MRQPAQRHLRARKYGAQLCRQGSELVAGSLAQRPSRPTLKPALRLQLFDSCSGLAVPPRKARLDPIYGPLGVVYRSGLSWGKRMTSRIESTPSRSIASRSMPMPSPPAGGMPYSNARR